MQLAVGSALVILLNLHNVVCLTSLPWKFDGATLPVQLFVLSLWLSHPDFSNSDFCISVTRVSHLCYMCVTFLSHV